MIKELFHIWNMAIFLDTSQKEDILEWIWRILVTDSRSPINHLDQEFIYIYTPQEPQPKKKTWGCHPPGSKRKMPGTASAAVGALWTFGGQLWSTTAEVGRSDGRAAAGVPFFFGNHLRGPAFGAKHGILEVVTIDIYWYYCYLVLNRSE